jgi:hypothetical protein
VTKDRLNSAHTAGKILGDIGKIERDKPLSRRALGTFTSLAFNTCLNVSLAVVAHTGTKPVSKRHLMRNTVEIGLDRWQSLDHEAWSLIVGRLKGRAARPGPRNPKPHQRDAIAAAKRHFIGGNAARGRLIMPCGTGKSLTAFWIAQALEAKTVVVAVPSLALIRQSVTDWTREFLAHGQIPDWICVCSDETVGNVERGISDFLGSKPSGKYVQMWPFLKARRFVRKLKLASSTEYMKWASTGLKGVPERPPEIPVAPSKKYKNQWRGWDDWLGRP